MVLVAYRSCVLTNICSSIFATSSLGGCMVEILSHLCPINFRNWSRRQFPEMWGMCAFRLFFLQYIARKPAKCLFLTLLYPMLELMQSEADQNHLLIYVGELLVSEE